MDATSEPTTAGLASASPPTEDTSTRSKNLHTDVAISNSEPAQDKPASTNTSNHPRAAQVDNVTLATTSISTSPAASFLGIPSEVRYMIYGYLWTRNIDVYIDAPRYSRPSTILLPISQVNRQVRLEAKVSLRRIKLPGYYLHATVKDLDFSNITSILEDFKNNSYSNDRRGGVKGLNVLLSLRHEDLQHDPPAPDTFEDFVLCLKRLQLHVSYDYDFTDEHGKKRYGYFGMSRRMITDRLRNSSTFRWSGPSAVRYAIYRMQGPTLRRS